MSRQNIREMKRSVAAGLLPSAAPAETALARDSALHLLNRSINFGHGRLAVVRLAMAVHSGADIPPTCWDYCHAAAAKDRALQSMLCQAAEQVAIGLLQRRAPDQDASTSTSVVE